MNLRSPLFAIAASTLFVCSLNAQSPADKPVVSGKFLGNGKDAGIQHLVVLPRDPFNDKAALRLIFTEKNPSASKKPEFDAAFKKLGSALIISTFKDGQVFQCEVAHTAHEKSPFSAIGEIKIKDFKVTETNVSGLLTTEKELSAFGQKWNVELTFSAPLPKGAFAAASEPAPEPKKDRPAASSTPATPAGPKLPVAKLPLPASAVDVEYKQVVSQIAFRSDSPVAAVSKDYSAKLKAAGWQDAPGSLNGKTNAILKRKLNDADLTIMIQPAGKGCTVKVFTQGLDWAEVPASAPAKAAKTPDAGSIEAEANRRIQDALKQIPQL